MTPAEAARALVATMVDSDRAGLGQLLAPDVVAYVTNAAGGSDHVAGRAALLERFPDFAAMADAFDATVTQIHEVDDHRVLCMVEIRAERLGRSLHNFAGLLLRTDDDGRLAEYRMVEALPEESDRFWAATDPA